MVNHTPQISSLPYQETFISGPSFWTSGGANSTWALGTPAKTVINSAASDTNSWVTGGLGTGSYLADETSYVLSPCFDMTSADPNTVVAMSIWWESEGTYDGTVLQSTNDGGATWTTIGAFGDPGNWYNYDESNTFSSLPESWSGLDSDGEGSGGWVKAIHSLDTAIIGKPEVRFRIAFSSDGSVQEEGFAFDDFTLGVPPQVDFGTDSLALCIGQTLSSGITDPNYTYLWSNGETTSSISIMNGTGADSLTSLWVQVTDTMGLTGSDTLKILIPASTPAISVVVDNDVLCNGDSTGQATVSGTGGFGNYTYFWGTNPPQNQAIATGLPAGTYDVIIIDEYNCSDATTVTISEPTALTAAVDSVIDASCYGESTGGVNVTITGGTMPYSFLWDDGSTTEDLAGVPAGMYTGTVTDANGCELIAGPISVSEPDSISVALASVADTGCPGDSTGSIDITVSGGTSPYTFNWSNGETTEDLTGLPVGSYTGTIVDDNGCVFVSGAIEIAATDSLPLAA
ncbi:MAG: hypothetical protein KDD63_28695, partial [Bacteroidetes bacterium]|nr:hypothetical protein [Bacteroidota bacterium]